MDEDQLYDELDYDLINVAANSSDIDESNDVEEDVDRFYFDDILYDQLSYASIKDGENEETIAELNVDDLYLDEDFVKQYAWWNEGAWLKAPFIF